MMTFDVKTTRSKLRLLVVANRLPISVKKKEGGGYDISPSSGGLVAALAGKD